MLMLMTYLVFVLRFQQKIEFAQASYKLLSFLELADSSTGGDGMPIDIPIGSDFYWQFMTGETRSRMYGGQLQSIHNWDGS